jgi:peptide subunit release factor RF-3
MGFDAFLYMKRLFFGTIPRFCPNCFFELPCKKGKQVKQKKLSSCLQQMVLSA